VTSSYNRTLIILQAKPLGTERQEFLRLLFRLPEVTFVSYPGLWAYCTYLKRSFHPLLEEGYIPVWDIFGV